MSDAPAPARVRPATIADAPRIQRLVEQSYAPYVARIGRRPAPMDEDYAEVLRSADGWVAADGDEIVGVVVARTLDDHVLLETLAVASSVRGLGLGHDLLAVVEAYAVAAGVAQVRLFTNEAMTENLSYYPRRGYRETGRAEQDGFHRVFFRKDVAPPAT